MTTEPQTAEARPWTRNPDGSYTCHRHNNTFRMPRSCSPCAASPAPQPDLAVTPFLPPPPKGCASTVELEADANAVRATTDATRTELLDLAQGLKTEMATISSAPAKSAEYYREYARLAEVRLTVLGELRKQGDLQLKANRRAGDYAARREDDYIVDKRNEAMRGGGSN